jgi:hypothetical protein
MKLDGTLGDGQSQTYTAGFTIARVVHAVKRSKDFVERRRGNTWPVIPHSYQECSLTIIRRTPSHIYLDLSTFPCVVDGIAHDVLNCAPQQLLVTNERAGGATIKLHRAITVLGLKLGIVGDFAY